MNIIYSNKKVEGILGVYANPELFNGDTENVKVCYTDDDKIKEAYEAKGIEVLPVTQKRTRKASE